MNDKRNRLLRAAMCLLLALHAGLLAWGAWQHSPSVDEIGHLPAGLSHWQHARFDWYRVNPPLVRMVAALPVLLSGAKTATRLDLGHDSTTMPADRPEFVAGFRFIRTNGLRAFWYFTIARWACIPFCLVGAYVCFRWASELYGPWSGILAMTLWCFSPNIIAHGQLITPDAGAAALGAAAAYLFWRWLKEPTWRRALLAGLLLGLAELAKMTLLLFFALWPLLWIVWTWGDRRQLTWANSRHQAAQLAVMLLLGLYLLNLGYGCEGSMQPLGSYRFISYTLGGHQPDDAFVSPDNRFTDTWLAKLPVPLPKNYVLGADYTKWEYERKKWSFLRGEWRFGGWWYYYLYALGVKVPLGAWVLLLLAAVLAVRQRGPAATGRDELVLLTPLLGLLAFVSSQTGFSHNLRYVLPIFPFAFIWMGQVARAVRTRHRTMVGLAAVALSWSVASSLWIYPHSFSYFNELVRGPTGGHFHLSGYTDTHIDWGQDFFYLKRWLERHPEAQPLKTALHRFCDVASTGIPPDLPPERPEPGWFAVSVDAIHERSEPYGYFLHFQPVAMAGYSIYVYLIGFEEANDVRRKLGVRELPSP